MFSKEQDKLILQTINLHSFFQQVNILPFTDKYYYSILHKPIIIKNSKTSPIGIFGCSVGYGSEKNLFAEELSKLTGRSVYNWSVEATGPQMMYYAIEKGDVPQNIKTFIYVYIGDHENRSSKFRCSPLVNYVSPRYNLTKNNEIKIEYPNCWKRISFIYRAWGEVFPNFDNGKKTNKLFYEVVMQSYKKLKKYNNCTDFIILNYAFLENQEIPFIDEFLAAGIKTVNVNELTGEDMFQLKYYQSEIDHHPNKKAWVLITSKLVKKYNF